MSGATTYTFFAIDKPLTPAQRDQVRRLSRRVEPAAAQSPGPHLPILDEKHPHA